MEGVWVIFAYDINAYPISIHADETEALRISNQFGYTEVKFWKFGELWEHLHRKSIQDAQAIIDKSKNN